jgi:glucokinase
MVTSKSAAPRAAIKHAFVSHSSADAVVATSLQKAIKGDGVPCWLAPRDVIPGQEYGEAIVEALKRLLRRATRCELYLGAGRDFDSFACVFIGTGVGSGIAIARNIIFGSNYCAGEIGHAKIASDGPMCNCGQTGCLETFVKAGAITDRARAKAIEWKNRGEETMLSNQENGNSPRSIVAALESGDAAAQEVADEIGQKLGVGIANYLNILNPGAVVLGGGIMSGFFMYMSDGVSRGIRGAALSDVANTPIVHSQYSDNGAALGAALLFNPGSPWPFS